MKRLAVAYLCALFCLGSIAVPVTSSARTVSHVESWKAFFAQILPASNGKFAAILGDKAPGHLNDNYYAVNADLDSTFVKNCTIDSNTYWSLFCVDLPEYVGATSRDQLVADITAALPSTFVQSVSTTGTLRWTSGHTIIFLVSPQSLTDDWGISLGNDS